MCFSKWVPSPPNKIVLLLLAHLTYRTVSVIHNVVCVCHRKIWFEAGFNNVWLKTPSCNQCKCHPTVKRKRLWLWFRPPRLQRGLRINTLGRDRVMLAGYAALQRSLRYLGWLISYALPRHWPRWQNNHRPMAASVLLRAQPRRQTKCPAVDGDWL